MLTYLVEIAEVFDVLAVIFAIRDCSVVGQCSDAGHRHWLASSWLCQATRIALAMSLAAAQWIRLIEFGSMTPRSCCRQPTLELGRRYSAGTLGRFWPLSRAGLQGSAAALELLYYSVFRNQ